MAAQRAWVSAPDKSCSSPSCTLRRRTALRTLNTRRGSTNCLPTHDTNRRPRDARPKNSTHSSSIRLRPRIKSGATIARSRGLMLGCSLLQHALEEFDLLAEIAIVFHTLLDLAHRQQHCGVIAAAEAAADLGQRARSQRHGEIHGDLERAHDVARPSRTQELIARHLVV